MPMYPMKMWGKKKPMDLKQLEDLAAKYGKMYLVAQELGISASRLSKRLGDAKSEREAYDRGIARYQQKQKEEG